MVTALVFIGVGVFILFALILRAVSRFLDLMSSINHRLGNISRFLGHIMLSQESIAENSKPKPAQAATLGLKAGPLEPR